MNGTRICPKCQQIYEQELAFCTADGTKLLFVRGEDGSLVGKTIDGKLELVALIGKGGMGTVYRAMQHSMGREVAVKVLRRTLSSDMTLVKRFLREAKGACRLNHPNIVTLFDFGQTDDGDLYLVMELLEGRTLAQVLETDGPLAVDRAVAVVEQVCDGLQSAHDAGIIHRDLKPDNVMLVSGAGRLGEFAKILDFGVAKLIEGEGDQVTKTGAVCGTPAYMSPEQAMGLAVDVRSDVYAIGILLYEALAGAPPFQAPSSLQLLQAHVTETPPELRKSSARVDVPVGVERLLMTALAKRPEDRPQTALDLKTQLTRAMRNFRINPQTAPLGRFTGPIEPEAVARATQESEDITRAATVEAEVAISVPIWAEAPKPTRPTPAATPTPGRNTTTGPVIEPTPAARRGRGPWMLAAGLAALALGAWLVVEAFSASPEAAQTPEPSPSRTAATTPPAPVERPLRPPAVSGPRAPRVIREAELLDARRDRGAIDTTAVLISAPPAPPPAPATIRIVSVPEGATVRQGDQLLGKTPVDVPTPELGHPVALELRLRGYKTQSVAVSAEQRGEVTVELTR